MNNIPVVWIVAVVAMCFAVLIVKEVIRQFRDFSAEYNARLRSKPENRIGYYVLDQLQKGVWNKSGNSLTCDKIEIVKTDYDFIIWLKTAKMGQQGVNTFIVLHPERDKIFALAKERFETLEIADRARNREKSFEWCLDAINEYSEVIQVLKDIQNIKPQNDEVEELKEKLFDAGQLLAQKKTACDALYEEVERLKGKLAEAIPVAEVVDLDQEIINANLALDSLNKERLKDGIAIEGVFTCKTCSKTFAAGTGLLTHRGYECDECTDKRQANDLAINKTMRADEKKEAVDFTKKCSELTFKEVGTLASKQFPTYAPNISVSVDQKDNKRWIATVTKEEYPYTLTYGLRDSSTGPVWEYLSKADKPKADKPKADKPKVQYVYHLKGDGYWNGNDGYKGTLANAQRFPGQGTNITEMQRFEGYCCITVTEAEQIEAAKQPRQWVFYNPNLEAKEKKWGFGGLFNFAATGRYTDSQKDVSDYKTGVDGMWLEAKETEEQTIANSMPWVIECGHHSNSYFKDGTCGARLATADRYYIPKEMPILTFNKFFITQKEAALRQEVTEQLRHDIRTASGHTFQMGDEISGDPRQPIQGDPRQPIVSPINLTFAGVAIGQKFVSITRKTRQTYIYEKISVDKARATGGNYPNGTDCPFVPHDIVEILPPLLGNQRYFAYVKITDKYRLIGEDQIWEKTAISIGRKLCNGSIASHTAESIVEIVPPLPANQRYWKDVPDGSKYRLNGVSITKMFIDSHPSDYIVEIVEETKPAEKPKERTWVFFDGDKGFWQNDGPRTFASYERASRYTDNEKKILQNQSINGIFVVDHGNEKDTVERSKPWVLRTPHWAASPYFVDYWSGGSHFGTLQQAKRFTTLNKIAELSIRTASCWLTFQDAKEQEKKI